MTVSFIAKANTDNGIVSNAIAINKPTGTLEDDLMFCAFVFISAGTGVITAPAGWTTLYDHGDSDADRAGWIGYKLAGASEPADYEWTWPDFAQKQHGVILTYRGCDLTTPIDANAFQNDPTTPYDAPSVTTTLVNELVIAVDHSNSGADTPIVPAGHADRHTLLSTSGRGQSVGDKVFAAAAATGVAGFTGDGDTLYRIALRNAGNTGGGGLIMVAM